MTGEAAFTPEDGEQGGCCSDRTPPPWSPSPASGLRNAPGEAQQGVFDETWRCAPRRTRKNVTHGVRNLHRRRIAPRKRPRGRSAASQGGFGDGMGDPQGRAEVLQGGHQEATADASVGGGEVPDFDQRVIHDASEDVSKAEPTRLETSPISGWRSDFRITTFTRRMTMAMHEYFAAGWHGFSGDQTLNKYVGQLHRKAKWDKRIRDALAKCEDENRPKTIVGFLTRADDAERRRILDRILERIREGKNAENVLDTIAATLIKKMRQVESEASMAAMIRVLVDIGPRILPVVSRSWQSAPSITQALGVMMVLCILIGKMGPEELNAALGQLKTAKDWIADVDDRACQAVTNIEDEIRRILQSSPAGT